ncbi:ribosome maturation factor RimM [Tistrella mobilis]|uniref:ribosome maturation factor RimM n=1 Tax=Tistrella mobilis TaxID=171437 RepID=UPI003558950F
MSRPGRPAGPAGGRAAPPQPAPVDPAELVCIAEFAAPQGVRGLVRLRPFTEDPEAVADYGPLYDRTGTRAFRIRITGPHKVGLVVKVDGVDDRDAAAALTGTRLHVPRSALPAIEDDEETWYQADLIGLEVVDQAGAVVGRVRAVHDFGAGDILEIDRPGDRASMMLPFTRAYVPEVSVRAGRMVIDPPEGLE